MRTARRGRIPAEVRTLVLPVAGWVVALGVVLFVVGSLRYSMAEALLVVLLAAVVLALVPWSVTRTARRSERAYWVSTPRQESVPPAALDYRLVRIRRDLRDAVERDDRPDEIYPLLRELTTERLRSRHDLDLDSEPERVRALVDPQLWRYLTTPPTDTRRRSRAAVHTALEGIEKL
ncbi:MULTISPECIES: hypothetical protein [unclassified Ornithinimicrobium]|uniref:hypothetical protein n=1 Tax=unclassified Ornithinimicrobium TaxID=2615080 RepID=UPI003853D70F